MGGYLGGGAYLPAECDVALNGKQAGFDYDSTVWSRPSLETLAATLQETIALGAAAGYFPGDVLLPRPEVFFVYVWVSSPGEVSRLVRIEDLEEIPAPRPEGASVRLRIQQWSDYSADGDLTQTEAALPSMARYRLKST